MARKVQWHEIYVSELQVPPDKLVTEAENASFRRHLWGYMDRETAISNAIVSTHKTRFKSARVFAGTKIGRLVYEI